MTRPPRPSAANVTQIHHALAEEIHPHLCFKASSLHPDFVTSGSSFSYWWKHPLHVHCIQASLYPVSFNKIHPHPSKLQ